MKHQWRKLMIRPEVETEITQIHRGPPLETVIKRIESSISYAHFLYNQISLDITLTRSKRTIKFSEKYKEEILDIFEFSVLAYLTMTNNLTALDTLSREQVIGFSKTELNDWFISIGKNASAYFDKTI